MRTLDYYVAVTLDGFIADRDGGFDFFLHDEALLAHYLADLRARDLILMGRRTYEVGLQQGVPDPYPWARSLVFSRSLTEPPHPRIELVGEDAEGAVCALKEGDGPPIYLCGGGELAASLMAAGLVDALVLKQHPVLLGEGVPLCAALPAPTRLRLETERAFPSGIVERRYAVVR